MKLGIIGCGNMGGGIARRLAKEHQLSLYDKLAAPTEKLAKEIGSEHAKNPEEAAAGAEVVILAVKPQNLSGLSDLKLKENQLLISLLAGVSLKVLKHHFSCCHLLRMMPNLAVHYGKGVVGLAEAGELPRDVKKRAEDIAVSLGKHFWLHENQFDALTSLTGSGPAFAFVLIESMIDAAIAMGFSASDGREFVLQMLSGSLAMLQETGKHPAELKWQVASPAGTTIAGLKKMEEERVRAGILNTFFAAYQRAQQLSS